MLPTNHSLIHNNKVTIHKGQILSFIIFFLEKTSHQQVKGSGSLLHMNSGLYMIGYGIRKNILKLCYLKCHRFCAPFFSIGTLNIELFCNHFSKFGRNIHHLLITFSTLLFQVKTASTLHMTIDTTFYKRIT